MSTIISTNNIGSVPNSTTIFQGYVISTGAAPSVISSEWDARTGGTADQMFEGTQAQITDIAKQCQAQGLHYRLKTGDTWEVLVFYPVDIVVNSGDNEPVPITFWELSNHIIDTGLIELVDRQLVASLDVNTKLTIQDNLRLNLPNNSNPFNIGANNLDIKLLNATILQNLLTIGISGRITPIPVLKRTAICSINLDLSSLATWNSHKNDRKVFTTSELVTTYSDVNFNPLSRIPPFIRNQMPNGVVGVQDIFTKNLSNPMSGYSTQIGAVVTFSGWLQYPVDTQQITVNKVQAQQSWALNSWSCGSFGIYDAFNGSTGPSAVNLADLIVNQKKYHYPSEFNL